jgi:hypothetical protein
VAYVDGQALKIYGQAVFVFEVARCVISGWGMVAMQVPQPPYPYYDNRRRSRLFPNGSCITGTLPPITDVHMWPITTVKRRLVVSKLRLPLRNNLYFSIFNTAHVNLFPLFDPLAIFSLFINAMLVLRIHVLVVVSLMAPRNCEHVSGQMLLGSSKML